VSNPRTISAAPWAKWPSSIAILLVAEHAREPRDQQPDGARRRRRLLDVVDPQPLDDGRVELGVEPSVAEGVHSALQTPRWSSVRLAELCLLVADDRLDPVALPAAPTMCGNPKNTCRAGRCRPVRPRGSQTLPNTSTSPWYPASAIDASASSKCCSSTGTMTRSVAFGSVGTASTTVGSRCISRAVGRRPRGSVTEMSRPRPRSSAERHGRTRNRSRDPPR
jgi:hypothetical protein